MKKVLTPIQMQTMEAQYFTESGLRSIDLMESAARALADILMKTAPRGTVYFACGTGGNGGDGIAAACICAEAGMSASILLPDEPRNADAVSNLSRAYRCGVPVHSARTYDNLPEPDIWCDALLGIGLTRPIQGAAAQLIARMNDSLAPVISIDVPSGLNALTGEALEPCVRAAKTVALQHVKAGLLLADGLDMCGEVIEADIGISEKYLPEHMAWCIDRSDIAHLLKPRMRNIHKGSCGHLLLVAGSVGMAGAAAIAANGALRCGAGLVSIACPESIVPILQTLAPCAVCIPMPERDGAMSAEGLDLLKESFAAKTAVAIGCGLSRRAHHALVRAVLECGLPAVADADALNLISSHESFLDLLMPHHILTPHPGEAARLLGHNVETTIENAINLGALGATVLLKGATSIISGQTVYLSTSGTGGMARGGSGDALTGIIGALLAEGIHPSVPSEQQMELTAALASEIHGIAGEIAAERHSDRSMTAMDIAEALGGVFDRYGG